MAEVFQSEVDSETMQKDLSEVSDASHFSQSIRRIIEEQRPERLLETGTYLGKGSTAVIAGALKRSGLDRSIFYSVECNPGNFDQAVHNLHRNRLLKYARVLLGISVPRSMLPTPEEITILSEEIIGNDEIFIDYQPETRVESYLKETDFPEEPDNLLEKILEEFDFKPDFVLLDSAGHMGFVEFTYLVDRLQGECCICLDDVFHIKHHKSYLQIKSDPRFEIIETSREKFGYCIAKFTPSNPRQRQQRLDKARRENKKGSKERHLLELLDRQAEIYIQANKFEIAEVILQCILSDSPEDLNALNDFSVIKILENNWEGAISLIEKVLLVDSNNQAANSNLAYIKQQFETKKKVLEAEKMIEESRFNEADIQLSNILAVNSKNIEALNAYAKLRIRNSDFAGAKETIQIMIETEPNSSCIWDRSDEYADRLINKMGESSFYEIFDFVRRLISSGKENEAHMILWKIFSSDHGVRHAIRLLKDITIPEHKKETYSVLVELQRLQRFSANRRKGYSQWGEESIIREFFEGYSETYLKFFVDAGAFNGIMGSNTRALAESGWGGILIEPNPLVFGGLKRDYEKFSSCVCLQNALSNYSADNVEMFIAMGPEGTPEGKQWEYAQVSTLNRNFADTYIKEHDFRYKPYRVNVRTLTEILTANGCPHDFGFISIDCEAEDLNVLKGLDLSIFRPKLICIESDKEVRSGTFKTHLEKWGYKFHAEICGNTFFSL
ncbi:MAG TPA: FkbM family methyltransferase [Candidatus Acidoferrales bacterium]|nr:FkbM family methyltransferase [Candidatus Acidoferrales bacterium]